MSYRIIFEAWQRMIMRTHPEWPGMQWRIHKLKIRNKLQNIIMKKYVLYFILQKQLTLSIFPIQFFFYWVSEYSMNKSAFKLYVHESVQCQLSVMSSKSLERLIYFSIRIRIFIFKFLCKIRHFFDIQFSEDVIYFLQTN